MEFRTNINPHKSDIRIDYKTPMFFVGSCFSEEVGSYLRKGKFNLMINPFGVLYNPHSIADSLSRILDATQFTDKELFNHNDRYISFNHDTSFSSNSLENALENINTNLAEAAIRFKKAKILFVTFGTARVYRFNESKNIVSNCHKIPADKFTRELLDVEDIVILWTELIRKIRLENKDLKIVFTLSPVRHWKDGAHGNQISKSILLLAIDKLITEGTGLSYFPSYELMMDDLRDYRFYKDDLLHPSASAIRYIWEYFAESYLDSDTLKIYKDVLQITKAKEHRLSGNNLNEENLFKTGISDRIKLIMKNYPFIDMAEEYRYFQD